MSSGRSVGPVPTSQASGTRFQNWLVDVNRQLTMVTSSVNPTTNDVAVNSWIIWKNTNGGGAGVPQVRLWVNDNGTMKSVTLT